MNDKCNYKNVRIINDSVQKCAKKVKKGVDKKRLTMYTNFT